MSDGALLAATMFLDISQWGPECSFVRLSPLPLRWTEQPPRAPLRGLLATSARKQKVPLNRPLAR